MKIERIELRTVRLRLREPFRISSGVTQERRILLVTLDGDGLRGWGECVAGEIPNYTAETVETARLMLDKHLAPGLLGRTFGAASEVGAFLDTLIKGHEMAKACLEMAAWDLEARLAGVPLASLLGGEKDAVPAGVSIGIQPSVGALLEKVEGFLAEGYQRIKLKVAPGWDAPVIERVRDRFPDTMLTVDANAAYDEAGADPIVALDGFGLAMIEQPLPADDLMGLSRLQRRLETPICLDESVTSARRCEEALHLGSGRIVNIKPGRVGGHASSKAIHDRCAAAGVPVWCGGMLESGVGRAHNVALASLPNFRLPGDTSASRRYWERDVVVPEFELRRDGMVAVPTGVGIGVEVDEEFLRSIEVERKVFG